MIRSILFFGGGFGLGYLISKRLKVQKENEKVTFEVQVPSIDDLNTFQVAELKRQIQEPEAKEEKKNKMIPFSTKSNGPSSISIMSNQPEQVRNCQGKIQVA
jgi:hypothetical protein